VRTVHPLHVLCGLVSVHAGSRNEKRSAAVPPVNSFRVGGSLKGTFGDSHYRDSSAQGLKQMRTQTGSAVRPQPDVAVNDHRVEPTLHCLEKLEHARQLAQIEASRSVWCRIGKQFS